MKLIIMRHSTAVEEQLAGTDARRWLTKEGRAKARRVAERLVDTIGEQAGLQIVSSPFARALQTAEIVASVTSYDRELLVWNSISPNYGDLELIRNQIASVRASSLVLVSHEPTVSALTRYLADESLVFSTGASVLLEKIDGEYAVHQVIRDAL